MDAVMVKPRPAGSIVPTSTAALRTMTIAMSAMCFLACLAIAGLLMVSAAASSWTSKVGSELTVQVRPTEGVDIEQAVSSVNAVLEGTPGIKRHYALSRDDSVKLLKPWLGAGAMLEDLPVPRLIGVVVDGDGPPDLDRLALAIEAATPGASLDSHRRWQSEMVRLAAALRMVGFAILLVIAATAAALVVYASRGALEANRDTIEVLYLAGARDRFIASQVERRFLRTGLVAGLAGLAAAAVLLALVAGVGDGRESGGIAQAVRVLMFSEIGDSARTLALFALVPLLTTVLCLISARLAVTRILRAMF
ncbi:MAG: FtsX-like permease family protein [Aestuariivirgaceae bacterium]|jgi:cell division transport system permease protein